MKKWTLQKVGIVLGLIATQQLAAAAPAYLNAKNDIDIRVEDLLSRMTLDEKVGQMCQYVGIEHVQKADVRNKEEILDGDSQAFYEGMDAEDIRQLVRDGLVGSFLHVLELEEANALQALAAESRLKIPLLIGIDAIHGNALVYGATVFPSPITIASSFDENMAEEIARKTALEMRATGSHWTFSPNVDIARDARWGRVGETFGEDPYLVGKLGSAMVRGYQGTDLTGAKVVISCMKHLIAGGAPVNGLNLAPMDVSEHALREIHLPSYLACIDAGCYSLMTAHNEINGVPCHANEWIVEELMRKEAGFDGFVVSDWMDIERLVTLHKIVENQKEAVRATVEAGMDIHMHGPGFQAPLVELVREGRVSESRIDASVRRILAAKFQLGLFEKCQCDPVLSEKVLFNEDHRRLALEAARKGIILLKNDNRLLPLTGSRFKNIVVTGPGADKETLLGDWVLKQPAENITTIYEGLQQVSPEGVQINLCDVGGTHRYIEPSRIEKAVEQSKRADLAVLVVGDNSLRYDTLDTTGGENVARSDIELPGNQLELVRRVCETGVPVLVVLVNGRPLSSPYTFKNAEAIIEALEPGCMGGQAVAEIIFGKVNPSGRLPFSIPRSVGHIQTIYNHKPSQYFRDYVMGETQPKYGFGYGLSYTDFEYGNLEVPKKISLADNLPVSLSVENTGDHAGDEVVLLYINDVVSSMTTPVKELVGFKRVHLEPGESKTVQFMVKNEQLALHNIRMEFVVEPGAFELFVGDLKADFSVAR